MDPLLAVMPALVAATRASQALQAVHAVERNGHRLF
jgi:hypothetical protein